MISKNTKWIQTIHQILARILYLFLFIFLSKYIYKHFVYVDYLPTPYTHKHYPYFFYLQTSFNDEFLCCLKAVRPFNTTRLCLSQKSF